jgi:hypothetical protein
MPPASTYGISNSVHKVYLCFIWFSPKQWLFP